MDPDAEEAYRFLAALQEQTLDDLGEWGVSERASIERLKQVGDPAQQEKLFAHLSPEHRDWLRDGVARMGLEAIGAPPTPYEPPLFRWMMREIAGNLEAVIEKLALPRPHRIWWGTLPTGRVNALALKYDPVPGRFVLFETHLFVFALLFAKAVAYAFPFTTRDGSGPVFSTERANVEAHLARDGRAAQRFQEALIAYLVEGTPVEAPTYLQEPEPAQLAGLFKDAIEHFVMAHEYGHVVAGHLDMPIGGAAPRFRGAAEISASHAQEFEADALGLALTLHALRPRFDFTLIYSGVELFLSVVEMVYRGAAMMGGTIADSHPAPDERREHLRATLRSIVPDDAERILSFSEGIRAATTLLWSTTEPRIARLDSQGRHLAPIWR